MEINCETIENLIKEFLEFESANDVADLLARMTGTYIANAPVDKKELANAAYVTSRLSTLFHNLEKLVNQPDAEKSVHIVGEKTECLHN